MSRRSIPNVFEYVVESIIQEDWVCLRNCLIWEKVKSLPDLSEARQTHIHFHWVKQVDKRRKLEGRADKESIDE